MAVYAKGTKAKAVCDRCGLAGPYLGMVTEPETQLRVHPQCLDEPVIVKQRPPEGIALRHPRPDVPLAEPWPGFEQEPEIYGPEPGLYIAEDRTELPGPKTAEELAAEQEE